MADEEAREHVFDVETDLPIFFNRVLDKAVELDGANTNDDAIKEYLELLDDTIRLLGSLREGEIHSDQNFLDNISNKYRELYSLFERKLAKGSIPSIVNTIPFGQKDTNNVGRPSYNIPAEDLENLRGLGFTWTKISKLFGVSRWTIYRRVKEYDIPNVSGFSHISDDRLDQLVTSWSELGDWSYKIPGL